MRIETLSEKKLVGNRLKMTFANNKTVELWRNFMPRRREIKNNMTSEMISMQVYEESFDFVNFNSQTLFEKWATVEVGDFDNIPDKMEPFLLVGGLYAIFIHKGSSTDTSPFHYIFTTWLPKSNYLLDRRPHFEVLGEKHKNTDPDSEEEIWIPIKLKK